MDHELLALARRAVGDEFELTPDQAARLHGKTASELRADARAMRRVHALWAYLTAPVLGASLGGLAYQFVRGEQTRSAQVAEAEVSEEALG